MSENKSELDFDFSDIEWQRGATPENIGQTCFQLCRDYLAGIWLQLTINDIVIRRMSGGLTNQLYFCAVNEDKQISGTVEPQEVVIRFYDSKHFNNFEKDVNERFNDSIVSSLVSENGLGPKIYGLFESGQIQAYYKHRTFRLEEQNDTQIVEKLAKILARVHAMDVPIKKTGNWVSETFDNFYRRAEVLNNFDMDSMYMDCNCPTLLSNNLPKELDWIKKTVVECESPVNFIHSDFRGSNIMITEDKEIVLCDFEYSNYTFRGTDFGSVFLEWGQAFGDWAQPPDFVSDQTLMPFVQFYIEESIKLMGNEFNEDKHNSRQHIIREGKVFSLVWLMFYVVLWLQTTVSIIPHASFDKKKRMILADLCFRNYLVLKQRFIDENVF